MYGVWAENTGEEMTFGSLFAGIGGIDLGLERAGMTCKWQVEIDPYCRKVLAKHWPDVRRYEDVREVGKHNLEPVDLVAGGFPCQDVSVAGKRAGIKEGTRSGLWFEFHRIICELRPRYVFVENVPGLLVNGMGRVLGDLASVGYDAWWQVLSAADMGAPHLRKRVFIVGYASSERCQGHRWSGYKELAKPHEQKISFSGTSEDVAYANDVQEGQQVLRSEGSVSTTPTGDGREKHMAHTKGKRTRELSVRSGRSQQTAPDANGGSKEIPESIHAQGQHNGQRQGQSGRSDRWATEPNVGRVAHGVSSRVDRLRGLGNAVVPQCAEHIGRQILRGLKRESIRPDF